MATDYFKMSEYLQKHSPLFMFFKLKICFVHCAVTFRNARHTRFSFPVNRRTCIDFAFCVSLQDDKVDTRKNLKQIEFKTHSFSIAYLINLKKKSFWFLWKFGLDPLLLSNTLNITCLMRQIFFRQKIWLTYSSKTKRNYVRYKISSYFSRLFWVPISPTFCEPYIKHSWMRNCTHVSVFFFAQKSCTCTSITFLSIC